MWHWEKTKWKTNTATYLIQAADITQWTEGGNCSDFWEELFVLNRKWECQGKLRCGGDEWWRSRGLMSGTEEGNRYANWPMWAEGAWQCTLWPLRLRAVPFLRLRDVMALHPISVIVLWSLISWGQWRIQRPNESHLSLLSLNVSWESKRMYYHTYKYTNTLRHIWSIASPYKM